MISELCTKGLKEEVYLSEVCLKAILKLWGIKVVKKLSPNHGRQKCERLASLSYKFALTDKFLNVLVLLLVSWADVSYKILKQY